MLKICNNKIYEIVQQYQILYDIHLYYYHLTHFIGIFIFLVFKGCDIIYIIHMQYLLNNIQTKNEMCDCLLMFCDYFDSF